MSFIVFKINEEINQIIVDNKYLMNIIIKKDDIFEILQIKSRVDIKLFNKKEVILIFLKKKDKIEYHFPELKITELFIKISLSNLKEYYIRKNVIDHIERYNGDHLIILYILIIMDFYV